MGGKGSVRAKRVTKQVMTAAKVKKIVSNLAEKKVVMHSDSQELLSYNNANWLAESMIPVSPFSFGMQIDQGVSQDQRIGNKIRPVKTTLDLLMTPWSQDATNNVNPTPVTVRIVVFSRKDTNDYPTNLADFFQLGSTSTAPTSNGFDLIRHVNRDEYTPYLDTQVKLGTAEWSVGIGDTPNKGNYANNDFSSNCRVSLDISKYIPSTVLYNDNNAQPSSRSVFVAWFAVRSDGLNAITTQRYGTVFSQLKCTYTDE